MQGRGHIPAATFGKVVVRVFIVDVPTAKPLDHGLRLGRIGGSEISLHAGGDSVGRVQRGQGGPVQVIQNLAGTGVCIGRARRTTVEAFLLVAPTAAVDRTAILQRR